jgi:carboxylesterase type B
MDKQMERAYREGPRQLTRRSDIVEAAWTDWAFRIPTIRLLEARPEPSWLYEFRWQDARRRPATGSFHGIDVPFSRDLLADVVGLGEAGWPVFGPTPPQELATDMHSAWVSFAKTGNPGWSHYETVERLTKIFDAPSELLSDAAGVERLAWHGKR